MQREFKKNVVNVGIELSAADNTFVDYLCKNFILVLLFR